MVLDGVDLDIEHESTFDGYPIFLETLYDYIRKDGSRKYYISGALSALKYERSSRPARPFIWWNIYSVLQ